MMGVSPVLCLLSPLVLFLVSGVTADPNEARLLELLFQDYNNDVTPVRNATGKAVIVKLGMTAIAILDVNVEENTMKMKSWFQMAWNDYRLQWDPEEFGGITTLRVPNSYVWRPDIALYNSAERDTMTPGFSDTKVLIMSDGTVIFIPPTFPKVTCEMDPRSDEHECKFTFGSWTYDGYKLDLDFYEGQDSKIGLGYLVKNKKWIAVSSSGKKEVRHYPCCAEPYPEINFGIKIKRRSKEDKE